MYILNKFIQNQHQHAEQKFKKSASLSLFVSAWASALASYSIITSMRISNHIRILIDNISLKYYRNIVWLLHVDYFVWTEQKMLCVTSNFTNHFERLNLDQPIKMLLVFLISYQQNRKLNLKFTNHKHSIHTELNNSLVFFISSSVRLDPSDLITALNSLVLPQIVPLFPPL